MKHFFLLNEQQFECTEPRKEMMIVGEAGIAPDVETYMDLAESQGLDPKEFDNCYVMISEPV